ncbi:hypothetical protein NQ117_12330 [Paenibacillus sp. SC116]|uniref:hypothetical protein n=1 Tax=Paenibacillus sp. SC116 TaxID=2968986 RepID=UPI00215A218B|nr:hypothetical protein [Paenibacillus sp. SC116]MCR8844472.1 hypothetical protein [Paenibacillus sp. SC116]
MYIVSRPKPLDDEKIQMLVNERSVTFPSSYLQALRQLGEGTYRGWMNVHLPDTEVLKPFAEYDLWEHDEDSPITQQQIAQCIAIGTTVDGDFLAVHPESAQLLWLPRHDERIKKIVLHERELKGEGVYAVALDEIYRQAYGSDKEGAIYYEPWSSSRKHFFLRLPQEQNPLSLQVLSSMCRVEFPPDQFEENEYTCLLFYQQMGGYVRFNYAYGQEVALFYDQDAQQMLTAMEQWLLSQGCDKYTEHTY